MLWSIEVLFTFYYDSEIWHCSLYLIRPSWAAECKSLTSSLWQPFRYLKGAIKLPPIWLSFLQVKHTQFLHMTCFSCCWQFLLPFSKPVSVSLYPSLEPQMTLYLFWIGLAMVLLFLKLVEDIWHSSFPWTFVFKGSAFLKWAQAALLKGKSTLRHLTTSQHVNLI